MPVGPGRVDIWIEIVTQLSRFFFRGGSIFASHVLKAIRADKYNEICQWSKSALEKLLDPLRAHVNANNTIQNRCNEVFNTINIKGELMQLHLWRLKGISLGLLKNIAYVACRSDVPDLNTALLLVKTQAVGRIQKSICPTEVHYSSR